MANHAPNPSSNGKRNALIGGGVAVLLLAVIGIGFAIQSNRDTTGDKADNPGESSSQGASPTAGESDTTDDPTPSETTAKAADTYGLGVGDPDAPVKVEVFEDYQCPFCQQFESASHDQLMEATAAGDAYVVYRPMAFINDYSGRALNAFGVVLDVSGGDVALKFHDLLFENQPSEAGPYPSDDDLVDLAVQAGAQEKQVRRGIEQLSFGQWVVNGNDAASKRGVNTTPSVFVDGEQVSGNTIEEVVANTLSAIEAG